MLRQAATDEGPNSEKIQRASRLGDEVYERILEQLVSLKIPPGARITVDSLVRDLAVSQTPIREALSRLEANGLVTKAHMVGYSAAPQLSRSQFEDLYELRLMLEPAAARKAAELMDDAAVAGVVQFNQEMRHRASSKAGLSYSLFARQDAHFHDLIAEGSGNSLIADALSRLYSHVHIIRLYFHSKVTEDAILEHDAIVESIKVRNSKAAEELMFEHLRRSWERLEHRLSAG